MSLTPIWRPRGLLWEMIRKWCGNGTGQDQTYRHILQTWNYWNFSNTLTGYLPCHLVLKYLCIWDSNTTRKSASLPSVCGLWGGAGAGSSWYGQRNHQKSIEIHRLQILAAAILAESQDFPSICTCDRDPGRKYRRRTLGISADQLNSIRVITQITCAWFVHLYVQQPSLQPTHQVHLSDLRMLLVRRQRQPGSGFSDVLVAGVYEIER